LCQNVTTFHTGVDDMIAGNDILIYPNPFNTQLLIRQQEGNSYIESVKLFDVLGRMVQETTNPNHETELTIPAVELSQGMYYIRITFPDRDLIKAVIKQ